MVNCISDKLTDSAALKALRAFKNDLLYRKYTQMLYFLRYYIFKSLLLLLAVLISNETGTLDKFYWSFLLINIIVSGKSRQN